MGKLTEEQINELQRYGYRLYKGTPEKPRNILFHPFLYRIGINVDTGTVFYQQPNGEYLNDVEDKILFTMAKSFLEAARILFEDRDNDHRRDSRWDCTYEPRPKTPEEKAEDAEPEEVTELSDESDPRVGGIRTAAIVSVCRGAIRFNQMSADLVSKLYDAGERHIVVSKDSRAVYLRFQKDPTKGSVYVREVISARTGKRSFVASRMDIARMYFGECEKTEQYDAELLPDMRTVKLTQYFKPVSERIVRREEN